MAGTHWTFLGAILMIVVWGMSGPLFGYSDTWQLVINTTTTIITFLMVFLIQNTQNRDNKNINLKLDELICSSKRARNLFADLDDLTDKELDTLEREFRQARKKKAEEDTLAQSRRVHEDSQAG